MQAVARKLYSEEEYWALEEISPFKNEFWDGEIVAMAGGTFNHGRIAANVVRHAGNKLTGMPCVALGSGMRVKVQKSKKQFNTYPDASIVCPPCFLVEVLSPSTAEFDQNEKFDEYKLIESLTDYILIWQDRVRVKHYHKINGAWVEQSYNQRSDSFTLTEPAITFSLHEIYESLDIPETPLLFSVPDDLE
jgi:Uma2 family endonuclease